MSGRICLVCGGSRFAPFLEILEKCGSCGFVTARLDEPFDAREVYDDAYFKGTEFLDYKADGAFFRRNFRSRVERVRRHRPHGRLLEIGSAYGFFLDVARSHFDVVGFEINAEAARYGREELGLDLRSEDFLAVSPEDVGVPVDVVAMWDVIEHLERPDRFLDHLQAFCLPGADLFVTTADIGSFVARVRGRRWRMIHPPSHLHYFDRTTVARLLANHGFDVTTIETVGYSRSIRQVVYAIFALKLGWGRLYDAVQRLVPAGWGFYLDLHDIILVHATRRRQ